MSRIEKHLVQDVQRNIILHTETSWPKEIFTEPVEPNDGEVALHKRKVVSIDVFVATGDDSYVKAIINRSDFNRIQTEMSTTTQAIEALEAVLKTYRYAKMLHDPNTDDAYSLEVRNHISALRSPEQVGQASRWISVDDVKTQMGWQLGASLPEGTVLAWRQKKKQHFKWEYGIYVENENKARDQFSPKGCEVILLHWPSNTDQG